MTELTPREAGVYAVITTTSLTRKEIAIKLHMHYTNVAYVEKRIYAKLGIPNRIALIFANNRKYKRKRQKLKQKYRKYKKRLLERYYYQIDNKIRE